MNFRIQCRGLVVATLLLVLVACGGGGEANPPGAPPPPPPPPPSGTIGAAGGTVMGPNGAKVEIPAGALAANVVIKVEQTSAGAPALPGGVTGVGQIFELTPHGTTFAVPVTITVPFDPATVPAGGRVAMYKTDAALTEWAPVDGATVSGNILTAQVTSFSDVIAGVERESPQRNCVLLVDRTGEHIVANDFDRDGWEEFRCEQQFASNPFSLDGDQTTVLETFSSQDGVTFFASAEDLGTAHLTQAQGFIKRAANATLQFVITEAILEAQDRNQIPTLGECPRGVAELATCAPMQAELFFRSSARGADWELLRDQEGVPVFNAAGRATLEGRVGLWSFEAEPLIGENLINVWSGQNFVFTEDLDGGDQKRHPRANLLGSIVINVDLSSIPVADPELEAREVVEGKFFIVSVLQAKAVNGRSRESAVYATLKDPAGTGGTAISSTGLELTTERLPAPQPPEDSAPTPCTRDPNPDPAAGVLQFSAATYSALETHSSGGDIRVTRTQGSTGAVSVAFTANGGTALPGVHYTPLTTTVYFADGDTTPRTVPIEILRNDNNEPDTTVTLALSEAGGCATVGSQSSAVLTILDDDRTPPDTSFTIGGTVSGLSGTGLVLRNLGTNDLSPGNGAFTFSIPFPNGIPYHVTVATQPTNPNQVCSVTNGEGVVNDANVTNVEVTCTSPPPPGGLDPGFGGGSGIVSSAFGGDETDMLLQGDGKILMVGGSSTDFIMARYDSDGSLDESFGDGGLVTTDIAGGLDAAFGAALLGDGRIIVVGSARVAGNDDFAVVRYLSNGNVDTSFGTQGKTTTDFFGARDQAFAVAVQPDNGIVVVGNALSTGISDFAIARYDANGVLDTAFGGGGNGKRTTDIAGGVDIAKNVVLESGDTILVTGTITMGSSPTLGNTGLARYNAAGIPDASFGTNGTSSIPLMSLGDGLALQPDGRILVAGNVAVGGRANFAVMRLLASGSADDSFGSRGLATAGFSTQDDYGRDVALDADGRILVSGQSSNLSNPNFAVARFDAVGALDSVFDADGKFTLDFFGASDSAENVAVQADGKIVLGGFAVNGTSLRHGLARINP